MPPDKCDVSLVVSVKGEDTRMFQIFTRRRRIERGFTLIELLIVVAIIAILAAILIPNFLRARAQSQYAASKGNLKNLATALESYFVGKASYPAAITDLATGQAYLRAIPKDPCTNVAYTYTASGSPPRSEEHTS